MFAVNPLDEIQAGGVTAAPQLSCYLSIRVWAQRLNKDGRDMKSLLTKSLLAAALALAVGVTVEATVARAGDVVIEVAPGAPPPPRVEVVPAPPPGPAERVVWVRGHWRWDGHAWAWEPGHYAERPRREAHWVEGHWDRGPNGWVWVEGHWG
jgi:hypothetical protein